MTPYEDNLISLSEIVRLIHLGDAGGMAALYDCISRGLRPHLARQLKPQDIEDKLHDIYVEVLPAICQGRLRDPERLMGFARTVARRKLAAYIDRAAENRSHLVAFESAFWLASPRRCPEREVIFQEHRNILNRTLVQLSDRERDVLLRFYIQDQDRMQICAEMGLTQTQFRLLKWRSKARFLQLSRKTLSGRRTPGSPSGASRVRVPA